MSVAALELRSVVCLPLVQVRSGDHAETRITSTAEATIGILYMDSRVAPADLSAGNRELLQTLAMEASTILENSRLMEEERAKLKIESELNFARDIQQGLLPRELPSKGWFRADGSAHPPAKSAATISTPAAFRPRCGRRWSPMFAARASARHCLPVFCKARFR